MVKQYKGVQGIGKTIAKQVSGCSWCREGIVPVYTAEPIGTLAGRELLRWIGEGICADCVLRMKRELQSLSWQKERRVFFDKKQFCADCETRGELRAATILDHIAPWRYRPDLFWHTSNWQGLCFDCHDAKSRLERGL